MIIGEVDINSQLPACRNNLTRSSTQEEVTEHLFLLHEGEVKVKVAPSRETS